MQEWMMMKEKYGLGDCMIFNKMIKQVLTVNDDGNALLQGMERKFLL